MSDGYAAFAQPGPETQQASEGREDSSRAGSSSNLQESGTLSIGSGRATHGVFDPNAFQRMAKARTSSSGEKRKRDVGDKGPSRGKLFKIPLAVSRGEISFARGYREGAEFINNLSLNEDDKDRLAADFSTALGRADRREGDLGRSARFERRGEGESDSSDEDDSEEDEGGGGEGPGKRKGRPLLPAPGTEGLSDVPEEIPQGARHSRKIREDALPWFRSDGGEAEKLTESMCRTRNIIEYINNDIRAAKRWVQSAPDAPINFPESEWENILKGRAVNLDKVYDALFIDRVPQEEVASLGGHEIVFKRSPDVKKGVESSGEWQSAWRATIEATSEERLAGTDVSSPLTKGSEALLEEDPGLLFSTGTSMKSMPNRASHWMGLNTTHLRVGAREGRSGEGERRVTDSTAEGDVDQQTVPTHINVANVDHEITVDRGVLRFNRDLTLPRPKYLRYNKWNVEGIPVPGVVEWSRFAEPFPDPPDLPFDHLVNKTINEKRSLFRIVTPVNVSLLRELLIDHPNDKFVDSVCEGFERGFCPWAEAHPENFPTTNDCAQRDPKEPEKAAFL
ncbi:hypothetical protein NP233_g2117 [Leucocoprinus birnbaumii]|uniref:Uncharacterized protein n=1 Tax=Leucocoprinus birnbaumii TaxID=56174 RepID=A0AAD5YZ13_9AGAR|nr:hypothetical protein NP233_g2117 [Leucocoprinus birnbaumii]